MNLSLRQAAKQLGVDRHTLRKWLVEDLGRQFPAVRRGSKYLVRDEDLLRLERQRRGLED